MVDNAEQDWNSYYQNQYQVRQYPLCDHIVSLRLRIFSFWSLTRLKKPSLKNIHAISMEIDALSYAVWKKRMYFDLLYGDGESSRNTVGEIDVSIDKAQSWKISPLSNVHSNDKKRSVDVSWMLIMNWIDVYFRISSTQTYLTIRYDKNKMRQKKENKSRSEIELKCDTICWTISKWPPGKR